MSTALQPSTGNPFRVDDPDTVLMMRLSRDDGAALDDLMRRHEESLRRYSLRLVQREDAAEDIVQESFVRLWENRTRWKPGGSVRSYLYRTAYSIGIGWLRHLRVRERAGPKLQHWLEFSEPSPLDTVVAKQLREIIQEAIDELPPRRRQALILVRIQDYSLDEAAAIMKVSRQSVANQVTIALRSVAARLRASGL